MRYENKLREAISDAVSAECMRLNREAVSILRQLEELGFQDGPQYGCLKEHLEGVHNPRVAVFTNDDGTAFSIIFTVDGRRLNKHEPIAAVSSAGELFKFSSLKPKLSKTGLSIANLSVKGAALGNIENAADFEKLIKQPARQAVALVGFEPWIDEIKHPTVRAPSSVADWMVPGQQVRLARDGKIYKIDRLSNDPRNEDFRRWSGEPYLSLSYEEPPTPGRATRFVTNTSIRLSQVDKAIETGAIEVLQ